MLQQGSAAEVLQQKHLQCMESSALFLDGLVGVEGPRSLILCNNESELNCRYQLQQRPYHLATGTISEQEKTLRLPAAESTIALKSR